MHDLKAKFTDKHPDVIQTEAQIAELERLRANDGSGEIGHRSRPKDPALSADEELAELEREESTLRSQIAAYNQRIEIAPRYEQELETLDRDYKTAKATYDSLQARYEEAQLADSLEQTKKGESFRILDPAVRPTLPAAPNRVRLFLMTLLFALGAGVGVMMIAEHLDTSFHSVGELRQFTTLPVLASIPYVNARADFASRTLRMALSVAAVVSVCALLALFAYHAARENTQLVWMLAGTQV